MKKGARTRQRLIDAACELLQRQGYHGTGLSQVLEVSQAPRGSLYFHFPGGKEQLACEAANSSGREMQGELEAVMDGVDDPREAAALVCEALAAKLEESDFQIGCPVATLALEMAPYSDPVQQTCSQVFAEWHRLIEARLEAGGVPQILRSDLAYFVLSAVEGALLLARSARSSEPLAAVARMFRLMPQVGATR